MLKVIILTIIQCFFLATAQVCFKFAVQKIDKIKWEWSYFSDLLTNWWLLLSGIFLILATILWGYILKNFEFSIAYPLTAFAYIFGMFAAIFIFNETVSITRWIGVSLIIIGTFFIVK